MRGIVAFIRLARLPFLFGGFAAFGLGAVVARDDGATLTVATYLWGQALVTSFHLMVHFSNDYFDQASDALTERTAWSGGSGVLPKGELPPVVALTAALVCAASGLALTVGAAFHGALTLALIGMCIAGLAWSYSAPPARLHSRGLGELAATIVVAVLVPLAGYATFAGTVGAHAVLATIPGAFALLAMMLTVELPDRAADAATGKRNLVVRFGEEYAVRLIRVAAILAAGLLVVVVDRVFQASTIVFIALVPLAFVVQRLFAPAVLRAPFGRAPVVGVALFATVTCAAIFMIAFAQL